MCATCQDSRVPSPLSRPEVPLKLSDQIIHELNRLTKKFDERLTLANLRLSDRFLDNELRILVHFRAKNSSEKWACCLLPILSVESLALEQVVGSNWDQIAVLVDVICMIKRPKRKVSALVWFERVDSFYRRFPRSLYFSSLQSLVIRGGVKNGKRNTLSALLAYRPALPSLNQLEGEVVKGATEVLQNIASSRKNLKPRDRELREVSLGLQRLRVSLGSDDIRVRFAKGLGLSFKVCEVLFGPFDFYPDKD